MAIFTSLSRRRTASDSAAPELLPDDVLEALPARFEAVAEALAAAADPRPACAVVGRSLARDGAGLEEGLDGLRATYELVPGTEPDAAAVESLSLAWGEATLEFLHTLSCEDPLTGMASLAHLRSRLDEAYREVDFSGGSVSSDWALVVVEMSPGGTRHPEHQFTRALRLVQVGRVLRTVFPGGETIGRVGADRAAVVARRGPYLGFSVARAHELMGGLDLGRATLRVWIEGLPASPDQARVLLDELARA